MINRLFLKESADAGDVGGGGTGNDQQVSDVLTTITYKNKLFPRNVDVKTFYDGTITSSFVVKADVTTEKIVDARLFIGAVSGSSSSDGEVKIECMDDLASPTVTYTVGSASISSDTASEVDIVVPIVRPHLVGSYLWKLTIEPPSGITYSRVCAMVRLHRRHT